MTDGLTKEKRELRDKLTTLTLDNSLKLNAYAVDSNKTKLKSAVKMTNSKLLRATDTGLRDYAQLIYDKAQDYLDALASYGITPATQTILLDTINAYFASISGPRVGINEKRQATTKLAELLDKADAVISKMDAEIGIIKLTQPTFFNGYTGAKKVVNTGKGTLALRAKVVDMQSGTAIKGVIFSFKQDDGASEGAGGKEEIVKKTADKGIFIIKSMPEGNYTVHISKPGYNEKVVTVTVADGEMSELKIELERA